MPVTDIVSRVAITVKAQYYKTITLAEWGRGDTPVLRDDAHGVGQREVDEKQAVESVPPGGACGVDAHCAGYPYAYCQATCQCRDGAINAGSTCVGQSKSFYQRGFLREICLFCSLAKQRPLSCRTDLRHRGGHVYEQYVLWGEIHNCKLSHLSSGSPWRSMSV